MTHISIERFLAGLGGDCPDADRDEAVAVGLAALVYAWQHGAPQGRPERG